MKFRKGRDGASQKVATIIEAEIFPASMHWDKGRLVVVDGEAGCT